MVAARKGSIVNLGSMSGTIINRPQTAPSYMASKGGVHVLTKALAAEWAGYGVRVNAVAPGIVETPFHERYSDQAYLDAMRVTIPLQRLAKPEDMVGPYLFLASEVLSGYMIGQVLEANGGQLMT